jgi:hypothetical protein
MTPDHMCKSPVSASSPVADLTARWRAEAARLRTYGAEPQAVTLEVCVRELEEALRSTSFEILTLGQASRESGYTYSALEKAIRTGQLPNAGEKGKPRRECRGQWWLAH